MPSRPQVGLPLRRWVSNDTRGRDPVGSTITGTPGACGCARARRRVLRDRPVPRRHGQRLRRLRPARRRRGGRRRHRGPSLPVRGGAAGRGDRRRSRDRGRPLPRVRRGRAARELHDRRHAGPAALPGHHRPGPDTRGSGPAPRSRLRRDGRSAVGGGQHQRRHRAGEPLERARAHVRVLAVVRLSDERLQGRRQRRGVRARLRVAHHRDPERELLAAGGRRRQAPRGRAAAAGEHRPARRGPARTRRAGGDGRAPSSRRAVRRDAGDDRRGHHRARRREPPGLHERRGRADARLGRARAGAPCRRGAHPQPPARGPAGAARRQPAEGRLRPAPHGALPRGFLRASRWPRPAGRHLGHAESRAGAW